MTAEIREPLRCRHFHSPSSVLGAMGAPMAENLVKRQFRVTGFDMRESAREALAAAGGHAAESAETAAEGADALVLMVVNAAQARSVLFEAGALAALAPGAVVMLMATCPPGEVEAIATEVDEDRPALRRFPRLGRGQPAPAARR